MRLLVLERRYMHTDRGSYFCYLTDPFPSKFRNNRHKFPCWNLMTFLELAKIIFLQFDLNEFLFYFSWRKPVEMFFSLNRLQHSFNRCGHPFNRWRCFYFGYSEAQCFKKLGGKKILMLEIVLFSCVVVKLRDVKLKFDGNSSESCLKKVEHFDKESIILTIKK